MPAEAAAVRVVGDGLGFTEGPLWTAEQRLWVVSISRGLIYEVDRDGGEARVVAEPGGNPSGLCQDDQGRVWIAQGGRHARTRSPRPAAPGIQRLGPDGVEDVVTEGHDAPNDLAIGPDGRVWFTDPRGAAMTADGPLGRVCSLDPDSGAVRVEADGIRYPNGLAFAGDVLYVAETGTARILRYVLAAGGLTGPDLFHQLDHGHPDGLALDADGHLYIAGTDAHAVLIVGPDGDALPSIGLQDGSLPTNLCFGGVEATTLFITAARGGRVLAVDAGRGA